MCATRLNVRSSSFPNLRRATVDLQVNSQAEHRSTNGSIEDDARSVICIGDREFPYPSASGSPILWSSVQIITEELRSKDLRINSLESELSEKDAEASHLKKKLENVEVTVKSLTNEIAHLQTNCNERRIEVEVYKSKLDTAKKAHEIEKTNLGTEIKSLTKELESTKHKHHRSVLDLTKEKHMLEITVIKADIKQKTLEYDIERFRREVSDVKAELELERQKIAEERRSYAEEKVEKLKQKNAVIQSALIDRARLDAKQTEGVDFPDLPSSEVSLRNLQDSRTVDGVRRVWGTIRSVSHKAVKNAVINISTLNLELRVKRKTKIVKNEKERWWFLLYSDEESLRNLAVVWERVQVQTGWKLERCTRPSDGQADLSSKGDN